MGVAGAGLGDSGAGLGDSGAGLGILCALRCLKKRNWQLSINDVKANFDFSDILSTNTIALSS
eukprot:12397927-Karenia_brevis.AAC.1